MCASASRRHAEADSASRSRARRSSSEANAPTRFRPEQVVAFEPDGPAWFSRGFRIRHNRADVPGRVYFACSGGRDVILAAVQSAGFVPCGAPFEGWRRPGIGRLVVIAMAIASALMLWR